MNGMTKKELATVAGYTYRRLHDIDMALPKDRKLFVAGKDGKYDLPTFVQRWVAYNMETVTEAEDDLDTVRARHEVIKTQKTELEVAMMRGRLIDVTDAKRLWGDIANTVMQNLIHLPNKLGPMLIMMDNAETIASIIGDGIRDILENLSEAPLPLYAIDSGDSGEDDSDE